jgi:hypothetical protein
MSDLLKLDLSVNESDIISCFQGTTWKFRKGSILFMYFSENSRFFNVYAKDGDLYAKDLDLIKKIREHIQEQNKLNYINELTKTLSLLKNEEQKK